MSKRLDRALIPLAAAAVLSACAASEDEDRAQTDVHCTVQQLVPLVVGQQVVMVDGKCLAWTVGPTPQEQRLFEQRHGRGSTL